MAKWRVYNRHPKGLTHREKFREDTVEIKAGKYILMDYEDATLFKGQYFPMKKDQFGVQTDESMKCISIEPDSGSVTDIVSKTFVSPLDGEEFMTQAELDKHIAVLARENASLLVKDETLDQELEKKTKKKTKVAEA